MTAFGDPPKHLHDPKIQLYCATLPSNLVHSIRPTYPTVEQLEFRKHAFGLGLAAVIRRSKQFRRRSLVKRSLVVGFAIVLATIANADSSASEWRVERVEVAQAVLAGRLAAFMTHRDQFSIADLVNDRLLFVEALGMPTETS
jgi:hypothetical protein